MQIVWRKPRFVSLISRLLASIGTRFEGKGLLIFKSWNWLLLLEFLCQRGTCAPA